LLGDLIYRHTGKVESYKVLEAEGPKIQTTIGGNANIKDETNAVDKLTYWSLPTTTGVFYSEGQGVVMTEEGSQIASWKCYSIGRHLDNGKRKADRGAFYYHTTSTGALAFLNNLVGVFEYEIDNKGNTYGKVWEWKWICKLEKQ
jgi:hypothetical protein